MIFKPEVLICAMIYYANGDLIVVCFMVLSIPFDVSASEHLRVLYFRSKNLSARET